MPKPRTTTTIAMRVPLKIRAIAEVLAADAGVNLSRWAGDAIRQKAVRDLVGDGATRRDLPPNTTLKEGSHDEE